VVSKKERSTVYEEKPAQLRRFASATTQSLPWLVALARLLDDGALHGGGEGRFLLEAEIAMDHIIARLVPSADGVMRVGDDLLATARNAGLVIVQTRGDDVLGGTGTAAPEPLRPASLPAFDESAELSPGLLLALLHQSERHHQIDEGIDGVELGGVVRVGREALVEGLILNAVQNSAAIFFGDAGQGRNAVVVYIHVVDGLEHRVKRGGVETERGFFHGLFIFF